MKFISQKRNISTLLISLSITLFSCTTDSVNDITLQDNIIGVWDVIGIEFTHPDFESQSATSVQGTITFNDDGTGKEDYSYVANLGVTLSRNQSFQWISTIESIIINPGTADEMIWQRLENNTLNQRNRYTDKLGITYTISLENEAR